MKKLETKGFTGLEIILMLVVLGLIAGTGWYVFGKQGQKDQAASNQHAPVQNEASEPKNLLAEAVSKSTDELTISITSIAKDAVNPYTNVGATLLNSADENSTYKENSFSAKTKTGKVIRPTYNPNVTSGFSSGNPSEAALTLGPSGKEEVLITFGEVNPEDIESIVYTTDDGQEVTFNLPKLNQ